MRHAHDTRRMQATRRVERPQEMTRGSPIAVAKASLKPVTRKALLVARNSFDGQAREVAERADLAARHPGATIQGQTYLRTSTGRIAKDPLTKEGRRVDFSVIKNGKVIDLVETTSTTANKSAQIAKETRIRGAGGTFIRDRSTGKLIDVTGLPTRVSKRN